MTGPTCLSTSSPLRMADRRLRDARASSATREIEPCFTGCASDPMRFGSLLEENLVDELFLTVSPRLAGGGSSPTISSGAELSEMRRLRLGWILERENFLYLRYLVGE